MGKGQKIDTISFTTRCLLIKAIREMPTKSSRDLKVRKITVSYLILEIMEEIGELEGYFIV